MKKVKAAIKRGVDVKIMAGSYSYINGEKINIINELGVSEYNGDNRHKTTSNNNIGDNAIRNPKVINHDVPKVKMIIRDNKKMMHIFAKFNDNGEIVTGSAIGILNHYD